MCTTAVAIHPGLELSILVELIVPNYVVEGPDIDFAKCRAHWVIHRVAHTSASGLETLCLTASHRKLLAKGSPR